MGGGEEKLVLLHVDDQPGYGELVAATFDREDDPVTVFCEERVRHGLATLASESVDCVISDLQMPGRDGLQFLKAIRHDQARLPFVLYTNRSNEEVASRAADHGIMPHLQSDLTGYFQKDGRQTLDYLTEWVYTTVKRCSTGEEQVRGNGYISGP